MVSAQKKKRYPGCLAHAVIGMFWRGGGRATERAKTARVVESREQEGCEQGGGGGGEGRAENQKRGRRGSRNQTRQAYATRLRVAIWRVPKGAGEAPANGRLPRVFQGNIRGDVACRVCHVIPQLGRRAVRFPCGHGRHLLHATVEALARGAALAPLCRRADNCGAQHPRRGALEAAVQEDQGLCTRTASVKLRRMGICYGWDQRVVSR